MSGPKRIQLSRRKGWRKPEGAVVVARPSRWGNPFRAKRKGGFQWVEDTNGDMWGSMICSTDREGTRRKMVQQSVDLFALHIGPFGNYEYDTETLALLRSRLRGRDLACWCPADQPCHADVLLELANHPDPSTPQEGNP